MTVHTVGDSHASFGWKDIKGCEIHHLGPILCYSFGRDKLKRFDIRNLAINHGDCIVFCMGEIDCRCHIHKYVTSPIPYTTIIEEIIHEYMNAIKMNLQICTVELKAVCVFNVVPPVKKNETAENPQFPYLGSDQDRKMYVMYFNTCLQRKCKENGFTYIDVYKYYTDNDGFLNKKYSDGEVHIKNPFYIQQFLTKLI